MVDAAKRQARTAVGAGRHALADARNQRAQHRMCRVSRRDRLGIADDARPQRSHRATKLFRGVDADEKLAEAADQWRLNLIAKGFSDAE
jgi:hypothetical protein